MFDAGPPLRKTPIPLLWFWVRTGWPGARVVRPTSGRAEGRGDGLIQSPEACDDDNTAPNDGCSATCTVEANYTCDDSEPSVCTMVECGNGIVDGTDECDDNKPNKGDRFPTTCTLEFDTMEAAEPNNTTPQVLTAVNHIVKGTYEDGDVDLYTFTLTATSQVEIEAYATIDGNATNYGGYGSTGSFDCLNDTDETKLRIVCRERLGGRLKHYALRAA